MTKIDDMAKIRDAHDGDLPSILDITNEAINNSTAFWGVTAATIESRREWLNERQACGYPVLVAEADGKVIAFGSFAEFRHYEAYLHTVEHSIYVDPKAQSDGVGKAMIEALIDRARVLKIHTMIAGIEAGNEPSIALHKQVGFEETGRLKEVGWKFDRWLDLVFMQKML